MIEAGRTRVPIFVSAMKRNRVSGLRIVSAFKPFSFRNLPDINLENEIRAALRKNFDEHALHVRVKENLVEAECWRKDKRALTLEFANRFTKVFCSLYVLENETPELLSDLELELKLIQNQNSVCMVCCEQIKKDKDRVVCECCKTPHHAECWNYFGGCSTFGCSETAKISDDGFRERAKAK